MKPWIWDRDRLVEQTLAFVESSAATNLPRSEAPPPVIARVSEPSKPPARALLSERDDILRRVAAFRAHQSKIAQARTKYCEAVLAQTRAVLAADAKRKLQ
jgi:hypothetical protein